MEILVVYYITTPPRHIQVCWAIRASNATITQVGSLLVDLKEDYLSRFIFEEIVQKFDGARVDELFRTVEEQVVRGNFNLNIKDNSGQTVVSEFGFK